MPPSAQSLYWRGKRGFEVGFFPANCVEMIREASLKRSNYDGIPSKKSLCPSSPVSSPVTVYPALSPVKHHHHSPSSPPPSSNSHQPTSPTGRSTGKFGAFLRFFVHLSAGRDQRQKPETSSSGATFGVDLTQHLSSTGTEIPLVLEWSSSFIERQGIVEGIYRLPGLMTNVNKLKACFNNYRLPDEDDNFLFQDVHSVASLLKLYFRELPDPLLTYDLYDDFIQALQPNYPAEVTIAPEAVLSETDKINNLKRVIRKLPASNRKTLEFLMRHLNRVATHSSETGMTAKNVAIVWAPNLLQRGDYDSQAGVAALHLIGIQAVVTEYLIRFVDNLFVDDQEEETADPEEEGRRKEVTQETDSRINCNQSTTESRVPMKQQQDYSPYRTTSPSRLSPCRTAPPPPTSSPPREEEEEEEVRKKQENTHEKRQSLLSPSISLIEETEEQKRERSKTSNNLSNIKKRGRFNSVDCVGGSSSKLIDVGGGPHSLPPKYHTIIQSISKGSSAGGTFSRRLRRSSSNTGWNNFSVLAASGAQSSSSTHNSLIETERGGRKEAPRIRHLLSP